MAILLAENSGLRQHCDFPGVGRETKKLLRVLEAAECIYTHLDRPLVMLGSYYTKYDDKACSTPKALRWRQVHSTNFQVVANRTASDLGYVISNAYTNQITDYVARGCYTKWTETKK